MNPGAIEHQDSLDSLHANGELIDGKYRLERVLGMGAMGRVWLARNVMLDLPVAIKIVDAQVHGRAAMARVLTEARLLAQLSHPNIVRVLDCHSDETAAYVVMERLEGCTLAELMDEGALPPQLAVRLAVPLLDALATAHRAGIVHRDIKPENIFVARRGSRICPKLLDFGVARSGSPSLHKEARLVVGTPGYMSPEQAWGEDAVDHRADIWAMGVVLYEAISGRSAFESQSYAHYLRVLKERKLVPLHGEDTTGLWMVLKRAMSPRSDERFSNASELGATLRLWLRARGLREDLNGDSLPDHWSAPGSPVHRAFCRSTTREVVATSRAFQRRRPLAGSVTLVDPRHDTMPDAVFAPREGRPQRRRNMVAVWAAVASALCGGTIALLHARADSSAQADAGRKPALVAAQGALSPHSNVTAPAAPAPEQSEPPVPATQPPTAAVSVTQRSSSAPRHRANKVSRSKESARLVRGHVQPREETQRAQASELGLKSPW